MSKFFVAMLPLTNLFLQAFYLCDLLKRLHKNKIATKMSILTFLQWGRFFIHGYKLVRNNSDRDKV